MATAGNVTEILASLEFTTVDELTSEIFDKLQVSVAIFNSEDNQLSAFCMNTKRCKCYYMLLHGKPNQCSIFDSKFVSNVLAKQDTDMLCDYACRLTMREMDICGEPHKIIIFQYNLDSDDLRFNPTNDPKYNPLYNGTDSTAIDYFWKPNVLTASECDEIFEFIRKSAEDIKSFF